MPRYKKYLSRKDTNIILSRYNFRSFFQHFKQKKTEKTRNNALKPQKKTEQISATPHLGRKKTYLTQTMCVLI